MRCYWHFQLRLKNLIVLEERICRLEIKMDQNPIDPSSRVINIIGRTFCLEGMGLIRKSIL